jgi:hypothetical protein
LNEYGGDTHVGEYIRYTVPQARAREFERAYLAAGKVLEVDEHCLGCEVAPGVEEPRHFVVRIEWDSIEGTNRAFGPAPGFGGFFAAVEPFFSNIAEMKHYEVVDHAWRRRPPLLDPADSAPVATAFPRPAGFTRRDRSPTPAKGGPRWR